VSNHTTFAIIEKSKKHKKKSKKRQFNTIPSKNIVREYESDDNNNNNKDDDDTLIGVNNPFSALTELQFTNTSSTIKMKKQTPKPSLNTDSSQTASVSESNNTDKFAFATKIISSDIVNSSKSKQSHNYDIKSQTTSLQDSDTMIEISINKVEVVTEDHLLVHEEDKKKNRKNKIKKSVANTTINVNVSNKDVENGLDKGEKDEVISELKVELECALYKLKLLEDVKDKLTMDQVVPEEGGELKMMKRKLTEAERHTEQLGCTNKILVGELIKLKEKERHVRMY